MPLYGDLDLHANNRVVALLNDQDQVIYQPRFPNPLPAILAPSSLHHGEIEGVLVESTDNWYWLVDGLMEVGYRVHLANPVAMQQYNGLKYTDDHSDARWLAHLLRLGVFPDGYIYPKVERAVRDVQGSSRHSSASRFFPCYRLLTPDREKHTPGIPCHWWFVRKNCTPPIRAIL